jgi:hypothetical protein
MKNVTHPITIQTSYWRKCDIKTEKSGDRRKKIHKISKFSKLNKLND